MKQGVTGKYVINMINGPLPNIEPVLHQKQSSDLMCAFIPDIYPLGESLGKDGIVVSESITREADNANNNVSIAIHAGRLYIAWRTAPSHFAGKKSKLIIKSTDVHPFFSRYQTRRIDPGLIEWRFELEEVHGLDVREPLLCSTGNKLFFSFFMAGTNPLAFQPKQSFFRVLSRNTQTSDWAWSDLYEWDKHPCIVWDMHYSPVTASLWASVYRGNHYGVGTSKLSVELWEFDVNTQQFVDKCGAPVIGNGGISEVAFEIDDTVGADISAENYSENASGIWMVGRNEDGDSDGFGTKILYASRADPCNWQVRGLSNFRIDSPRMFKHNGYIYVIGRYDIGGPYNKAWQWLGQGIQKWWNLMTYSLRPKKTALYLLDTAGKLETGKTTNHSGIHWNDVTDSNHAKLLDSLYQKGLAPAKLIHIADLPYSYGDTAFPSIVPIGDDADDGATKLSGNCASYHRFLVANYTSHPHVSTNATWIRGQLNNTNITFTVIDFAKVE